MYKPEQSLIIGDPRAHYLDVCKQVSCGSVQATQQSSCTVMDIVAGLWIIPDC